MQTFLPFPDFRASAEALDYRRLGKQRVEAFQLLVANDDEWALEERSRRGLKSKTGGWRQHPATIMWHDYPDALKLYMNVMIEEWMRRGYQNSMAFAPIPTNVEVPHWLGDEDFHASHRSSLLRKDFAFYSKYGWLEKPDMEYVWPKQKEPHFGLV